MGYDCHCACPEYLEQNPEFRHGPAGEKGSKQRTAAAAFPAGAARPAPGAGARSNMVRERHGGAPVVRAKAGGADGSEGAH